MGFQSTVNAYPSLGTVGDIFSNRPVKALTYNLNSSGQAQVIGYAYTVTAGGNPMPTAGSPLAGTAQVGGTGVFAGILAGTKQYTTAGTGGSALAATLTLPDNSIGELVTAGEVVVSISNTASVGDTVYYNNTTGALTAQTPGATVPSGSTLVPNATISRFAVTAAGLAVLNLSN